MWRTRTIALVIWLHIDLLSVVSNNAAATVVGLQGGEEELRSSLRRFILTDFGPRCGQGKPITIDFSKGVVGQLDQRGILVDELIRLAESKDWNWPEVGINGELLRPIAISGVFAALSAYEGQTRDERTLLFLRSFSLDKHRELDARKAAARHASNKDRGGLSAYLASILNSSPEMSEIVLRTLDASRSGKGPASLSTLSTNELEESLRRFRVSISGTPQDAANGAWIDGIISEVAKHTDKDHVRGNAAITQNATTIPAVAYPPKSSTSAPSHSSASTVQPSLGNTLRLLAGSALLATAIIATWLILIKRWKTRGGS